MRAALREALGRAPMRGYVDSISEPIAMRIPSSGGHVQVSSHPEAMSNAPTLDVSSGAGSMPREPFSSNPGSFGPKDTSAGTALAPQVARKKSNAGLFAFLVAIVGLGIGVSVILVPRMRKAPKAAPSGTITAATDLDPLEQGATFASPLGSASGASSGAVVLTAGKPPIGQVGDKGPTSAASAKNAKGAPSAKPGPSGSAAPLASTAPSAAPAPTPEHPAEPAGPVPSFNAQNAHVELGLTNPTGVKVGPLRKQFDSLRPQLNACYKDALTAKGQRVDGAATFNLSIDSTGLISGVVVTGLDQLPQATRCFQNTLFHKQLPANALDGPSATAEVWVTLRPE
jgi:hypothetical protein